MSILEILLAYQSRPNDRVWSGCVYPQDAATGNPYKFSLCLPIESQSAMLVKFSANVADLSTSEGRSERGWDFKLSIGVNCDFYLGIMSCLLEHVATCNFPSRVM